MADSLSDEDALELMRLRAEHARVQGAKMEMLYVIAQRKNEIKRLDANVAIQDKRLAELVEIIDKMSSGGK